MELQFYGYDFQTSVGKILPWFGKMHENLTHYPDGCVSVENDCFIAGRGNERAFTALGFGHSEREAIDHARRREPHITKFWDMIDVRKVTVDEYWRLACYFLPEERRRCEPPTSLPASWIGGRDLYSLKQKDGRYIPVITGLL